nr:VOC family protein [Rhabdothermincola salaria]
MAPPVEGMPSFWMVYFHVDDVAGTVERARTSGAQVHMEAMTIPGVGTMATLADPQGAVFSVMTPEAGQGT